MVKLRSIAFFLALSSIGATCRGPGRESHAPALLRVKAFPEDARVRIDERTTASARVLAVRPRALGVGHHQITIEAPGYFPHDLDVDLPAGETTIEVRLRAVPP